MPPHIQLLPDDVVNKIAAGEVVERPASVLKEVMENALDAGATRIDVEVVEGGRKAILVSDNGCGMSRDDALMSLERHATSKIRRFDDLERVATMGFRGEALAAIASVSRLTLTTRAAGAEGGAEVSVSGGKVLEVREAGGPPGTQIAVRNLFFNVPARRKFLRSDLTELHHLRQIFLFMALARPEVGMRFAVDGREVYRLAPGPLADRLRDLFGRDIADMVRAVDLEHAGVHVTGFAGLPQVTRPDRSEQYVFVNRRAASAPAIGFAISEAYKDLIPRGRHPVVFLFLELDPAQVDVNVHPTKREVRFRQSTAARDAVVAAIRKALQAEAAAAPTPDAVRDLFLAARARTTFDVPDERNQSLLPYPAPPPAAPGPTPPPASPSSPPPPAGDVPPDAPWHWCRVLGRVGGYYVVLETGDGLVLMDPQAAHERVLYERLLAAIRGREVQSQGLLRAETVALRDDEAAVLRRHAPALHDMGFGISDFGGSTLLVDALPACLGEVPATELLRDLAASLAAAAPRGEAGWLEDQTAQAAAQAAVRSRQSLSPAEIERLVADLARTDMPYTSPRGRPTTIFLGLKDLHRKFGRT